MKPADRVFKKWRKETPEKHRSYSEKRNRSTRMLMEDTWQ